MTLSFMAMVVWIWKCQFHLNEDNSKKIESVQWLIYPMFFKWLSRFLPLCVEIVAGDLIPSYNLLLFFSFTWLISIHFINFFSSFNAIFSWTTSCFRFSFFCPFLLLSPPHTQTSSIYYYLLIRVLHISVTWWSFTWDWVTASLLKSSGLFSVFWPFSIMLLFGWHCYYYYYYYYYYYLLLSSFSHQYLLMDFEWQQVSSSPQDSSQYPGRPQQCCRLDSLYPSANFQVLQAL